MTERMKAYQSRFEAGNRLGFKTLGGMSLVGFKRVCMDNRMPVVSFAELTGYLPERGRKTIRLLQEPTPITQLNECIEFLQETVESGDIEVIRITD